MNSWILVPWGNGYLRLTHAEFDAAMARGLELGPSAAPVGAPVGAPVADQGLLTSAQIAERLNVTPEFCEVQAKQGAWPAHRLGKKYLRFSLHEVIEAIAKGNGDG